MDPSSGSARERRAIRVRGVVQGVGFRPAMVRLARRTGVCGLVRNDSEGVWIEIESNSDAIRAFLAALPSGAPALARIDSVELSELATQGDRDFRVVESVSTDRSDALVPADAATCDACLKELFDPGDRRYRYPFINCTDCGPRLTIVVDLPYDRARTTMRGFRMCPECAAEYNNPTDRRYHAEPNACPACGPQVQLVEGERVLARGDDAIRQAVARLAGGAILALKGIGGYQLAVDAADGRAIARLRERKRRPHKPLALMARDLATIERLALVDPMEQGSLLSAARPIVLLLSKARPEIAENVAPGLREVGVMLPATPLHHLLLNDGPAVLVVTSGNRAEEPIAIGETALTGALGTIADAALVHNRPIHTRADDSVVRVLRGAVQPIRRARGLVPGCVPLRSEGPSILAVGAQLKNTVCITRHSDACVSQHIGDQDTLEAREFFEETIAKLCRLLGVRPQWVAHDMHPDYAPTGWALSCGLPAIAVQHHHAHVAACMVDNGYFDPVIGVAFDGTGCGPAGELWGGEFLIADLAGFLRVGHLRALPLPGGEAAIREPWRLALAALVEAQEPAHTLGVDPGRCERVRQLLQAQFACVRATGAGRWFDAVAAILQVRTVITYEGQAAIELEALASRGCDARPYPFGMDAGEPFVVDLRPFVRAAAADDRAGIRRADIALRFHATLAEAVCDGCRSARDAHGLHTVALSGGCFQNRILTELACARLEGSGFRVLVHRRVPANDGGIALGQAAVAHHLTSAQAPPVPKPERSEGSGRSGRRGPNEPERSGHVSGNSR
jgi:hydrogenase maturation protein HypF